MPIPHSTAATRHFSGTYAEARRKFLDHRPRSAAPPSSPSCSQPTGAPWARSWPPTWPT